MRAAVVTGYGPPEVLRIEDVAKPTPRENEVLVRVHATTVNRTDCGVRGASPFLIRLFYGPLRPRARALGNEFAGEVEAVGGGVRSFRVGDRVFGFNTGLFGVHGEFGAQAEYMVIPEDGALATMPESMAYEEAAPATEGSHYALSLIRRAEIRSGQEVLVYGATGAIGSAAVQLLKSLGAGVTAVCDTKSMELVRSLPPDCENDQQGDVRSPAALLDLHPLRNSDLHGIRPICVATRQWVGDVRSVSPQSKILPQLAPGHGFAP